MVSSADVEAGIVAVVPAVVVTSMDVSKIPVELTEDVVSAAVVPRVVLSTEVLVVSAEVMPTVVVSAEVVARVVVSAEVVPRVVLSTEVVPRVVASTADGEAGVVIVDAAVPAVVITSLDVSKIPVELTEDVVSA